MTAMIGPMLRILVVALLLLVGIMLATTGLRRPLPAPVAASYFETPLPLPEFSLVDDSGAAFTRQQLRGRFTLLFFGFTNCPDICPLTLSVLADAGAALKQQPNSAPATVFVSVDPNRDTPERIAAYLDRFDPAFTGATGPEEDLEPLLRALGVTVHSHAVPGESSYNVTHNGTVYVIGPAAELIATFGGAVTAEETVTDYRRIRQLHLQARSENASSS
jgi:protein SCO1/2